MLYRVRLNAFIEERRVAEEIYKILEEYFEHFRTVSRGEPSEERSFLTLERCFHDEVPPRPCEELESKASK